MTGSFEYSSSIGRTSGSPIAPKASPRDAKYRQTSQDFFRTINQHSTKPQQE